MDPQSKTNSTVRWLLHPPSSKSVEPLLETAPNNHYNLWRSPKNLNCPKKDIGLNLLVTAQEQLMNLCHLLFFRNILPLIVDLGN